MSIAVEQHTEKDAKKKATFSKRALLRVLAVVIGLVAVASACDAPAAQSGPNPINGYNSPTKPAGMTNGNLPASVLRTYSSTCRVWYQEYGPLSAMILAAKKAGITLNPAECYRDYAGQVYWRNWWCKAGKCGNAAVPGTSNHGWGKAVDMHDASGGLPTNGAAYNWMRANAGRFGFINPILTGEAWHWEWVGDGGTMHGYQIHPGLFNWPLHQGDNSDEVKLLQLTLSVQGYPVNADGNFGASTTTAVKNFQARHGLAADGVVGNATAWALRLFS